MSTTAAIGLRRGGQPATTLLLLWSSLFVVVGVNWDVSDIGNGFDAGWGDSLFGYVGTPLAVGISALLVAHEVHLRTSKRQPTALAS